MTQQATIPPDKSEPDGKILPAPGTNQIAGFVEFHLLTHTEKKMIDVSYSVDNSRFEQPEQGS